MLKVGPNPYGLCCTLGLQGSFERPKDIFWFIELAESMQARCIEFHFQHVAGLSVESLSTVRRRLAAASIQPIISGPWPLSAIPGAFPLAKALGVKIVRTHLSPILCGARAAEGPAWNSRLGEIRADIKDLGPKFIDEDLTLAIENHQDFGSEELMEFCEIGGPSVGITLDTGNPLAVGEAPLAFARVVAPKVRHIHLKDYRVVRTEEGYRLVRCAIGDGAIPLQEMAAILEAYRSDLTASIEPGALESRHVRLLTTDWWSGYPARSDEAKQACLEAAQRNAFTETEEWRTPWELGLCPEKVSEFEIDQMTRSVQNMKSFGWLPL